MFSVTAAHGGAEYRGFCEIPDIQFCIATGAAWGKAALVGLVSQEHQFIA